ARFRAAAGPPPRSRDGLGLPQVGLRPSDHQRDDPGLRRDARPFRRQAARPLTPAPALTAAGALLSIVSSSPTGVPEWWNWQTRTFEGRVEKSVRVRIPPPAPFLTL